MNKFTSDARILEIYHQFTSQGNKSMNMRMVEVASKTISFSRTESLEFCVCYVVGIHNLGYLEQHTRVLKETTKDEVNCVLHTFLMIRDSEASKKKTWDTKIKSKCRRKHAFKAKVKDQLYRKNTTDPKVGPYQSGIGAAVADEGEKKAPKKRKKYTLTPCDCGASVVHYRSSSKHCLKSKRT